ncbi:hypothetical protein T492DRAFT_1100128 [Pavlovales sp. CCMP2436]|nr:hypothetical protein T492DRAFT_1100128 [Pavlovales sp. CCMP2436]|mmetsp:Transcript_51721/g.121503  ORF Transcript_51721/g.121503 Transcript_51721/m.121503 type:complete len:191 (-) Transcript_51721:73-645(-)
MVEQRLRAELGLATRRQADIAAVVEELHFEIQRNESFHARALAASRKAERSALVRAERAERKVAGLPAPELAHAQLQCRRSAEGLDARSGSAEGAARSLQRRASRLPAGAVQREEGGNGTVVVSVAALDAEQQLVRRVLVEATERLAATREQSEKLAQELARVQQAAQRPRRDQGRHDGPAACLTRRLLP